MIQIHGINPQQAHAAMMAQMWPWVKAQTTAGHAVVLEARLHEDVKTAIKAHSPDGTAKNAHGSPENWMRLAL